MVWVPSLYYKPFPRHDESGLPILLSKNHPRSLSVKEGMRECQWGWRTEKGCGGGKSGDSPSSSQPYPVHLAKVKLICLPHSPAFCILSSCPDPVMFSLSLSGHPQCASDPRVWDTQAIIAFLDGLIIN